MHLFLKLFILVKHSTSFGRSFRPSSGAYYRNILRYITEFYLIRTSSRWQHLFDMIDGKTIRNM
jgi:hypothetical protein